MKQKQTKMASKEYDQALEILNWEEGINGNEKLLMNSYGNVANFSLNGRNVCSWILLI